MGIEQEDITLSKYAKLVEKVSVSSETEAEIWHKLHIERVKLYASIAGIAFVFALLTAILFFHTDPDIARMAGGILNTFAGGLVGFLVRRP